MVKLIYYCSSSVVTISSPASSTSVSSAVSASVVGSDAVVALPPSPSVRSKDLYRVIAEYLSVLLVTRENLSIASRLCSQLCEGCCDGELYDELRNIGLQPDDAETTGSIILEYLCSEKGYNIYQRFKKKYTCYVDKSITIIIKYFNLYRLKIFYLEFSFFYPLVRASHKND